DRVIECFIDREIEVEGKKYATLMPADTPVIIAGYLEVDGSRQLVPVLDDERIDTLFPTASAVLAEMDLVLSRSAVVLTLIDSTSHEEEGSDDGLSSQKKEDDESEKVQVLATFYYQDEKYVVAAPLEPVLI
ncbi:hypothetical protein GUITHDRAFT_52672, partial [Guillardia theta CCMP2712]